MSQLLNQPVDISSDFADTNNTYFCVENLLGFDPETGEGKVRWKRHRLGANMLFNHMVETHAEVPGNEWPGNIYAANPELPFSIHFLSENTLRVRMQSSATARKRPASIMLAAEANGGTLSNDASSWNTEKVEGGYKFASAAGSVFLREQGWGLEIRDRDGKLLTRSEWGLLYARRHTDYSRSFQTVFSLAPDEKIFGCGESFTGLNKRGQKVQLWTTDALSTEKSSMYKPVPFFLSSAGYGMFLHTSAPSTFDFGSVNSARNVISTGDDELDLFIFLGSPKEVIEAYTAVTGRASMPPLWSFGLWMSRITYWSEKEVREVAEKARENRIPCDVIHLDTGWFETEWKCDYKFAPSRFDDPKKMVDDLAAKGFSLSLWQIPYFVPDNVLFPVILEKGLAVVDAKGNVPAEDAVLDFSNPDTVAWYQEKLAGLLRLGVRAIKTDFGEAAPRNGLYASGTTGFYEHNLYPLRYQSAAAQITKEVTGDAIVWARAGWAGAQRNPVHWGGDAGKSFSAMAGTLRAGLSIGISGFSFWSHDIGGFGGKNNMDVYRAWLPFGMFTSHSRVHGEPPKEPWEISPEFTDEFRVATEMRYRLMPYIYAQAKQCVETGLPMLRALFVEFPEDPGAWLVDDEYLFGSDFLVAPLFEANATSRMVYVPGGGKWIDYQTGKTYATGWHRIAVDSVPAVILVRDGVVIPRVKVAQSTQEIDWAEMELAVFASESNTVAGLVCLPADQKLHRVEVERAGEGFALKNDPFAGKITWRISSTPGANT